MKAGNPKNYIILILISFLFKATLVKSNENIDLNVLQPTFEEETVVVDTNDKEKNLIKSKKNNLI